MISGRYFPWMDKKYEKRLYRYFYLKLIQIYSINIDTDLYTLPTYIRIEDINDDQETPYLNLRKIIKNCEIRINKVNTSSEYEYKNYLFDKFNLIFEGSFDEHKKQIDADFSDFKNTLNTIANQVHRLYNLLIKISNKSINEEIKSKFVTNDKLKMTMWGGNNYTKLKNKYLNIKGGRLNFRANNIDNFSHHYTPQQISFLRTFFENTIKNITIDGIHLNDVAIEGIKALGCGSFGCSAKIKHNNNKSYIFKIIEDKGDLKHGLPETYFGYYMTQNRIPNTNIFLGYINTNSNISNIYFSSISDNVKYNDETQIMLNTIPLDQRNKDIFMIIMNAGTDDMSNFKEHLINNPNFNDDPKKKNKEILKTIINMSYQILNVIKLNVCYDISNKCTYFLHSDIKPANSIFIFDEVENKYKYELIDFGAGKFSSNFFNKIDITTIVIKDSILVFPSTINYDDFILSPLYDLCASIHSFIWSLLGSYNEYKNYLRLVASLKTLFYNSPTDYDKINTELINIESLIEKEVFDKILSPVLYSDKDNKKK